MDSECRFANRSIVGELVAESVSFAAGDFQIEHQILDVEPQLREGVLNEGENPAASEDRLDNLTVEGIQVALTIRRKGGDALSQFEKLTGKVGVNVSRQP
jgi:hypothetical protein